MTANSGQHVIILGTSPVLLIEGLVRARAGQQITFVESNSFVGGAWSVANALDLQDIEAACHLIVNYRGVYQFLAEICDIPLERVEPVPLLYRKGKLTPFNARRHVLRRCSELAVKAAAVSLIRPIEMLCANRWKLAQTKTFSIAQAMGSLADHRLYRLLASRDTRAVCYPIGGAPAMLRSLVSQLKDLGAEFVRGRAEQINLRLEEGVRLLLDDGQQLQADTLVVSESAYIGSVQTNEAVRKYDADITTYQSLFVRVENMKQRKLSYVELPQDRVLERVTDVTPFCQGELETDSRILVFELPRGAKIQSDSIDPHPLIDHLQGLQLLPTSTTIAEHALHELCLHRSGPELFNDLRELHKASVTVVSSRGDFAMSIHRNLNRWKKMSTQRERIESQNTVSEEYFNLADVFSDATQKVVMQ